jgi:hypothetical protein
MRDKLREELIDMAWFLAGLGAALLAMYLRHWPWS